MKKTYKSDTYRAEASGKRNRFLKLATALGCLFLAFTVAETDAKAEIIDRIAASINKEIVTLYDVSQAAPAFLLNRQESPQQLQQPGFLETIQNAVLKDLVDRKLYEDDAKQIGIGVSDEELERYLAGMRQQQGFSTQQEQAQALEQYGVTFQQFKDFARSELLRMRLLQVKAGRAITISDAEVERKYQELTGGKGDKTPYIEVAHINLIPQDDTLEAKEEARERAKKVLERLNAGEKFADVAEEMSDDEATAENGGLIGKVHKDSILPEFANAAFALPVDQISDIVETPAGYHIILVLDKGEEENPDAKRYRDIIRAQLMREQQEKLYREYIQKLKQRSYVDIKLKD